MYIPVISEAVKAVGSYFNKRQEVKAQASERVAELEMARHLSKVEAVKRGDTTESDYDLLVLKQAQNTWIDEVMILWVLAIVTCLFIPALAPYAVAGFTALSGVPLWFQTVFVGCFIAKLGLRFLFSGRTLFGSKVK